eukprot:1063754-Rhodomonas_salina.2
MQSHAFLCTTLATSLLRGVRTVLAYGAVHTDLAYGARPTATGTRFSRPPAARPVGRRRYHSTYHRRYHRYTAGHTVGDTVGDTEPAAYHEVQYKRTTVAVYSEVYSQDFFGFVERCQPSQ